VNLPLLADEHLPTLHKTLDFAFPIYLYGPIIEKGLLEEVCGDFSRDGVEPKLPLLIKRRVVTKVKTDAEKKSAARSGSVFRVFPLSTSV